MIRRHNPDMGVQEIAEIAEATASLHEHETQTWPIHFDKLFAIKGWTKRFSYNSLEAPLSCGLRVHDRDAEKLEFIIGRGNSTICDRYTIARGMGHRVLHMEPGQQQAIFYERGENPIAKHQAHTFALHYLMPLEKVLDAKYFERTEQAMVDYFQVARTHIIERLGNLTARSS